MWELANKRLELGAKQYLNEYSFCVIILGKTSLELGSRKRLAIPFYKKPALFCGADDPA